MNKILVAMDFSKGALHALEYAIKIANHTHSDLILVWVDALPTKETGIGPCKNEERRDAKMELQKIVEEKSALLHNVSLKMKMRKGKVYQELALEAKSTGAELIVVGTHGLSGFEEFWIGSNAYKIISYAPCPVVSVRVDYDLEKRVKTILLPIDNSVDSTKKLPHAAKLAKAFDAEIFLLGLYTTKLASLHKKVDRSVLDSEKYLKKKNVSYQVRTIESPNIASSVVGFASEVNADMVVIMTDQEKANLNILVGDYSQKIINLSTMPILSVKPENLFD